MAHTMRMPLVTSTTSHGHQLGYARRRASLPALLMGRVPLSLLNPEPECVLDSTHAYFRECRANPVPCTILRATVNTSAARVAKCRTLTTREARSQDQFSTVKRQGVKVQACRPCVLSVAAATTASIAPVATVADATPIATAAAAAAAAAAATPIAARPRPSVSSAAVLPMPQVACRAALRRAAAAALRLSGAGPRRLLGRLVVPVRGVAVAGVLGLHPPRR
eukprot:scaffold9753_cov57-Phaeocystis_antarctica.AAC.1